MIDIKFLRENPDIVRENIRKKFQDAKLPLVDEVIENDAKARKAQQEADEIRANKKKASKQIGALMAQGKKDEAMKLKEEIADDSRLKELDEIQKTASEIVRKDMMTIPNIIDPSVPIGKDDSENVELQRFGEPVTPDFPIPYHTDIMARFDGVDFEAAGRVAGNGFYYLKGDIARLHSAILSYARDFMIDRGFTYYVPPFMIRSAVVDGVMSFAEMDAMMYKIEGEDLYLIGTSEHSMIGSFIDQIIPEESLPKTLTSYSPCFRKEKGAHGIEERGVYRIHQFEKQEMIVVCKPEESMDWYEKLWKNTVDFFRSIDIPVRQLECCSGDLADLKVKSCDVEAWSPRQQKYFEVGSCSNLGDAQARRLRIRVKGSDGKIYLAHTLNNTCVATPRMLIAFLENNLHEDGSVSIPQPLQMYMGGKTVLTPLHD
jgi:seryl-tRNA synthetase